MSRVKPAARDEVESVLKKISSAQDEAVRRFKSDLSELTPPVCAERLGRGSPLLAAEEVRVDWGRFDRLLADLLKVLEEWTGQRAFEGGQTLDLSGEDHAALLGRAIQGQGAVERRGGELGAAPDMFALAVRYALAPFMEVYAGALKDRFAPESCLKGRCPVCGAEPFMAELDGDDGRRRLACGLCGTQWRFPRLKCPFCENEDQKKLGFLEVDGLDGYRVDVCEACRRYVKTLDRRTINDPLSLELAEALTPELDEAALERGYGLLAASGRG